MMRSSSPVKIPWAIMKTIKMITTMKTIAMSKMCVIRKEKEITIKKMRKTKMRIRWRNSRITVSKEKDRRSDRSMKSIKMIMVGNK